MKIALFKGSGIIATLIRWQSRSSYAHAAVIDENGVVYEALTTGVRSAQLWTTDHTRSDYDLFEVETTPEQNDMMRSFLWRQLGKRYDFTMVLRFLTREQETRNSTGKWFCSELVFAAFAYAGIKLFERTEPWEVSPGMLARTPLARVYVAQNEVPTLENAA
jgi:uncharacterized protein YycO